jgi:polysaccharide biosynthesis/export protein
MPGYFQNRLSHKYCGLSGIFFNFANYTQNLMRKLLLVILCAFTLTGCGWLNPSIMLKTPKDYQFSSQGDSTQAPYYRLSPNDILEFSMYSNDGFKLIDLTSLNNTNQGYRFESELTYIVEPNGEVKFPIIGKQKVTGLTIQEAELFLEDKYSTFYIRPFVILRVTNKRVIVFPGSEGAAKVIPLDNNNTTLIEAIALAGGISDDGKAKMVKVIRNGKDKHEVYLLDLSTINGIKDASMILQANDIVYIEPRRKYASKFLSEIAPIVSIVTSAFVLYSYSVIISKK